jgi:micrococcal nuclease
MKKIIVLSVLILTACTTNERLLSLEEYFLSINYVQEQENGSKNEADLKKPKGLSEWAELAYTERCEWFDLERIVDGDTIIVDDGDDRIRVRMIGIDTPESKKEGTAIQPFALDASEALANLLTNETEVCLVEDKVGDKYDTYGRKLSYVFTATGSDLNAMMIELGWAEAYTGFPMERAGEFEGLETSARERHVGQWE